MSYLKDVSSSYLSKPKDNGIFWHRHIICFSNFFISEISNCHCIYIDGTCMNAKDYKIFFAIAFFD